jgi:hypothetical protein
MSIYRSTKKFWRVGRVTRPRGPRKPPRSVRPRPAPAPSNAPSNPSAAGVDAGERSAEEMEFEARLLGVLQRVEALEEELSRILRAGRIEAEAAVLRRNPWFSPRSRGSA